MKLLVAVDGSEQAPEAARRALRLYAAGLEVEFVLATVQEPTFLDEMVLPPMSDQLERVSGAVGHRDLEAAEALVRGALLGSVSQAVLQAPVTVLRRIDAQGPV